VTEQSNLSVEAQTVLYRGIPLQNAIGGFFIVLQGGIPRGDRQKRFPRSAAGTGEEGRVLYLLVIDGYRRDSIGATEEETGRILQLLGATEGLILDGGGSSVLVARTPAAGYRSLNVPMHNRTPHQERAVGLCLGIRITSSGPNISMYF